MLPSYMSLSAAFRLELPSWFIRLFTREADVVLDPFIGVGRTALAAVLLGRNYIGIENSPNYFEEAKKNLAELSDTLAQANPT